MTMGKDDRCASPVHVHVNDDTPVHVHVKKGGATGARGRSKSPSTKLEIQVREDRMVNIFFSSIGKESENSVDSAKFSTDFTKFFLVRIYDFKFFEKNSVIPSKKIIRFSNICLQKSRLFFYIFLQ